MSVQTTREQLIANITLALVTRGDDPETIPNAVAHILQGYDNLVSGSTTPPSTDDIELGESIVGMGNNLEGDDLAYAIEHFKNGISQLPENAFTHVPDINVTLYVRGDVVIVFNSETGVCIGRMDRGAMPQIMAETVLLKRKLRLKPTCDCGQCEPLTIPSLDDIQKVGLILSSLETTSPYSYPTDKGVVSITNKGESYHVTLPNVGIVEVTDQMNLAFLLHDFKVGYL